MSRGGPVDIGVEPLLDGDRAAYVGQDGLYSITTGLASPQPIGPRLESTRVRVLSPGLHVAGGRSTAVWLEKWPEGNRLLASACGDGKACWEAVDAIADKIGSTLVRLEPVGDGLYAIDATPGRQPVLSLTRLSDSGVSRQSLPVPNLDKLGEISTLSLDGTLYIFFNGRRMGRELIGALAYDTRSEKVSSLETVIETPFTPLIEALVIAKRPALLFKAYEQGHFSLNLAVREADGWRVSPVAGADGLDVARLDWHVWPDARLLVVFSGEQRERTKQRVYAALSDDLGAHWRTRQLDSAEFANTRAWLPRLTVDGERVAVVWEDSHDIRARIRMQLSRDRGEHWLARDIPLSVQGAYAMRPRIEHVGNELSVAWHQYRSDKRDRADLILRTLSWDEAWAMAGQSEATSVPADRKPELESAVHAAWKAITAGDQAAVYEAYDPFYRAKLDFERYRSSVTPFTLQGYEIQDLVVQGNEAQVTILADIPAARADERSKGSGSSVRYMIRETWLHVDGRWYRKFVDDLSGASAIAY
ncbi:hypothetical protein [Allochromatium palmeri]|uniref:Uncharacterized protein n=1 Tax=Allochromatium palmeri TaxID=231048 RepID=A0A6N8E8E3_9GAMM|nr:hypothetical protein [Allochromatium palmeri]MTW19811.1 hypothetical protein [Allochromatium palmeri]